MDYGVWAILKLVERRPMADLHADEHPCTDGYTWVVSGELDRELWWEVDPPLWFVLHLTWGYREGTWVSMTSRFEQHPPSEIAT